MNGIFKQLMKSSIYDFCVFAKKAKTRRSNSILDLIYQNILKFSNMPEDGCPIPADKYLITAFKFDGSNLPALVPSGIYLAYFNVLTLENNVKISFVQLSFEIRIERL